jgi:molybdate transport system substrate-binding protein
MSSYHHALRALALLLAFITPAASQTPPADVTVFAAASVTNALQDIASAYARKGGGRVKFAFAASSTLAKQIESGAGAQLFLSADQGWMDYVEARGLHVAGTRRPLLGNRLVLVTPAGASPLLDLAAGRAWLDALPPGRIATGDPAHVPVGRYAEQALTRLGLWAEVRGRLARADNVRNALVLVERGEAVAGIVYSTDAAVSKQVRVAGVFPETAHDPIVYPVVLLRGHDRGEDRGEARRFYDFLFSDDAKGIFASYGFTNR